MNNTIVTINIIGYEGGKPIVLNPKHVPIVYVSTAEDPIQELQHNEDFYNYIQETNIVDFGEYSEWVENIKKYLNTDICIATYTIDELGQDVYDTKEYNFQDFYTLGDVQTENIKKSIVRYCFDYLFDKAYQGTKDTSTGDIIDWWKTLSETFGDKLTKETLINSIRAKMQSPKYDVSYPLFKLMNVATSEVVLDYIKEQLNITE